MNPLRRYNSVLPKHDVTNLVLGLLGYLMLLYDEALCFIEIANVQGVFVYVRSSTANERM